MNYRLYSFVANHYLSPLQCGLQTAHVVAEMTREYHPAFEDWASESKTIIICAAGNHGGVIKCYNNLRSFKLGIGGLDYSPISIFMEDMESMNCMATACGIIVPEFLYDAQPIDETGNYWSWLPEDSAIEPISLTEEQTEFCKYLKSFRLA